jgi:hypothetical protein
MIALRFSGYALSICVAAVIFAGCGSTSTSAPANCNSQSQPFAQLLYPIPGSKNVDPKGHILILAGNEHWLPFLGGQPFGKLIPPPSPLPQPELTPAPGASLYAASIRTLRYGTKYGVSVSLHVTYCDGGIEYPKKVGSFTTQSK